MIDSQCITTSVDPVEKRDVSTITIHDDEWNTNATTIDGFNCHNQTDNDAILITYKQNDDTLITYK